MISNKSELYRFIDSLLTPHGYIKKKETWYKRHDEVLSFISMGKSPFSGKFEEAIGIFFVDLIDSKEDYPEYHKSGFKIGIQHINANLKYVELLDLENMNFPDFEREAGLKAIFENTVVPFLDKISTIQGFLSLLNRKPRLKNWVMLHYKKYLGLPIEE